MKVFISADIEGVSGITAWDEARKNQAVYREFQLQMTRETAAACEGALAAGATEVWVKDAHADAGNLLHGQLPPEVTLVRGWSGHPMLMVQELDDSFACALFVGYHARAGAGGNPLSHTLSSSRVHRMFMGERAVSEFYIHYLAAGLVNVPVVMLAGDETICAEVASTDPAIHTVAVKHAHGPSTISVHPDEAVARIRKTAEAAVTGRDAVSPGRVPGNTVLQIVYKDAAYAYGKSFYPGARLVEPYTVEFASEDYFEVLRSLRFLV